MGESWGDLMAAEYLFENGFRAPGDTPVRHRRLRHRQPRQRHPQLRHAAAARSTTPTSATTSSGRQVHADGEIWAPTNLRVRSAFAGQRYGVGHPGAAGASAPTGWSQADACPGNRRWVAADVRLVPAPGVEPGQHARHARQHARRRPGPLRRGQPGHHLERVRAVRAWARDAHERAERRRPDAELRLAVREQRHA